MREVLDEIFQNDLDRINTSELNNIFKFTLDMVYSIFKENFKVIILYYY